MAPANLLLPLLGGIVGGLTGHTPAASTPIANENGPYSNPYDAIPPPMIWPGVPKSLNEAPPPRPAAPFPYGGDPKFASKYFGPAWVPDAEKANGLIAALKGIIQNGLSKLGAVNTPHLPNQLDGGITYNQPEPDPTPGQGACGGPPDTGVTRFYDFTVSYATIAPDGVMKNGLVINGAFPGPLIEANWGDWIEINVKNDLPNEGTTLHWHGLLQSTTPWFDGVPAVSQCPIVPGGSFTYRFRADLYGTSWYHSHYSAQYAGGAVGPMVIHGPKTADYDVDLGPVMLSDWYHQDYFTIVKNTMNGIVTPSNNNLINGKMNYPCQSTTLPCTPGAGISKFRFFPGRRYRLRLINTSAEGLQKFSIDDHTLTVIANDFVPIVPYDTNVVTLGVGQRTDVIVQAKFALTGAYYMRANLGTCSFTDGISPLAVAAVYYPFTAPDTIPTSTSDVSTSQVGFCGNDDLSKTVAWCPITPDPNPPTTDNVKITFGSNGTNFVWFMNGESFRGDFNDPTLLAVGSGNLTFEKNWNVINFGTNSSVRLVIENTVPFTGHPMHLHGHNFHVLAEGFGKWDGVVTNPDNTQRRDVQFLHPAQSTTVPSYIVLQWKQDNPAVWPLHCHIAWHVSAGLYINVLERPDDIMKRQFPQSAVQACRDWATYTNTNIPDQIDSGL